MTLFRGVFDIPADPAQAAIVKRALRRCDFPYETLLPGMAKHGVTRLKVRFKFSPLGHDYWGYFSGFKTGDIFVNPTLSDYNAQRTVIHESAHAVDAYWMHEGKREKIHALPGFHPAGTPPTEPWRGPPTTGDVADPGYLSQADEGFANGFGLAFWVRDASAANFTHVLRPKLAERFRTIVLRANTPAEPPVPPVEPPSPTPPMPPDPLDEARACFLSIIADAEAGLASLAPEGDA